MGETWSTIWPPPSFWPRAFQISDLNYPIMKKNNIPNFGLLMYSLINFFKDNWKRNLWPFTHYLSLFVNNNKTTFSWKKLSFVKHDESTSTHYSSLTTVFVNSFTTMKRVVCVCHGDHLPQRMLQTAFHKNVFKHDKSLSTHYSHFARVLLFISVSSLFANNV